MTKLKGLKIKLGSYFFTSLLGLGGYFLIYLPLEFWLTEVSFRIPKVDTLVNTAVLFTFLVIACLLGRNKLLFRKKWRIFFGVFILLSFLVYGIYRREKLSREFLPKIYRVLPSWVIQGQPVVIKGANFGPVWKPGEVIVDGMRFQVKKWSEEEVIAEVSVPAKVGYFEVFIKTQEGKISNAFPLEIKNPDYLKKYLQNE